MPDKLRHKAKELLRDGAVKVVIGYGEGSSGRIRALFIRDPEESERLVFDSRCLQNLAVYLAKREVRALGKPAIVAPLPVLRAIDRLANERQIKDGDIAVIGVSDSGDVLDLPDLKSVAEYVSGKPLELTPDQRAAVGKIDAMSPSERWNFWLGELSACIKCYACRAGCPLCYCERCTVECNQPQWISVPSHDMGNIEWHVMRAMHLAGRCVNCGDCARNCPLGIPLDLLNQRIIADIAEHFGAEGGYALSAFKPDDTEDFIR